MTLLPALCAVQWGQRYEDAHRMKSDNAIAIALSPSGTADNGRVHWWRIIGGEVVESGDRIDWLDSARGGSPLPRSVHMLALAPTSAVGLHSLDLPALGPKQAAAVARRTIAEGGLMAADALHVVRAESGAFASVTNGAMQAWQDWAGMRGLAFDSIVPIASLIDEEGESEVARRAVIGAELLIRKGTHAFVDEPALTRELVGDAPIADVPRETIERAMVAACDNPPAELMTGPWARRSGPLFDTRRLALIAKLTGALLLLSLSIPLIQWIKITRDSANLDEQSVAAVGRILSPVPPTDRVIRALDTKLAALGGGGALLSTPLIALITAMEPAPTVAIDALAWHGDGVLSVTLAAPRNDDINPVLIALQSAGYRITAQSRSGSDGRTLADITMRSAP
ncbi:MAG: type II secretion system protein GspL [Sphingopyxis sp.]